MMNSRKVQRVDEEILRLDVFLHRRGFAESRQKARQMILNGNVYIDGVCVCKPSAAIRSENLVEIRGDVMPYVGRGGLKLEAALRQFGINVQNLLCVDIGASTGGFTDCLLQHGAGKVYAVDSGTNQLADKLRRDPRVVCMENLHVKNLEAAAVGGQVDLITADVSFISLTHVFPAVSRIINPCAENGGKFIALIKPQFEAGRAALSKKGIVRDTKTHLRVILALAEGAKSQGLCLKNIMPSPVLGGDGNREYLSLFLPDKKAGAESLTENEIYRKCFEENELSKSLNFQ